MLFEKLSFINFNEHEVHVFIYTVQSVHRRFVAPEQIRYFECIVIRGYGYCGRILNEDKLMGVLIYYTPSSWWRDDTNLA